MNPALALAVAAAPAFLASVVECAEAYTIVLAVGNSRGWRAPLWALVAASGTLAALVLVFGAPLVVYQAQVSQSFHLAVGTLLLLFGMRWLRKAILRFANIVALHDEELIYQREVAELRAQGLSPQQRWDHLGFWVSYKAVLLEGLEIVFIVLALGAQHPQALTAAILGAIAAFLVTSVASALFRHPHTRVPENWMKCLVGAMLVTFGIFWGAAGLGVEWALGDWTLLVLFAGVCTTAAAAVRVLGRMLPRGAQVAARRV